MPEPTRHRTSEGSRIFGVLPRFTTVTQRERRTSLAQTGTDQDTRGQLDVLRPVSCAM